MSLCVAAGLLIGGTLAQPVAGLDATAPGQARRPAPRGAAPVIAARDPAWSPSGSHIALAILDQIWIMTRDGLGARPLVTWSDTPPIAERDPAWSPDSRQLAFAADHGEGFDLYIVAGSGGEPQRLTYLPGDERWPSWTADGHLVFAAFIDGQWDLQRVPSIPPTGTPSAPVPLTDTPEDETEPRVSPDGRHVAFVSTRESAEGETDIWMLDLAAEATAARGTLTARRRPVRIVEGRGDEWSPTWAPDGQRIAFAATRDGVGSLWVTPVDPGPRSTATAPPAPAGGPVLVSRRAGQIAWSPDGRTLLVTGAPDPERGYNGQPQRDRRDRLPLFAGPEAYGVRFLPAPLPPDSDAAPLTSRVTLPPSRLLAAFDRVWDTLARLYYRDGPAAERWLALRDTHRPRAAEARDPGELEAVVDALVAEQPLVREPVSSTRAVVVSGHPLASAAGARVLERGGNVVDAAIATSFTLGVVEPDASGIGGDGMALVFLKGMHEPVVVDFKDQTPIHATLDNPAIFEAGRIVDDGPAAANIPGLVAGMDLMFRRFGSGKVSWASLFDAAIEHAQEGFVLDEALPTTIREGQAAFRRHETAAAIYLPGGRPPRPGDRFVNRDLAATLRAIATRGATEFYQGDIARRIARDMSEHGGIIRYEDLAQYRAIERAPVSGRYRDHLVFSTPPPVGSGTSLVEVLQILDHLGHPRNASPADRADYLHVQIEAWKLAHPLTRVADPALWPVDIAQHLGYEHAGALFEQIDMRRASPGRPAPDTADPSDGGAPPGSRLGRGTTAFAVADTEGNFVVVTQTLSTWGGSFYASEGLGFLYNNHLRLSRTRRGAFGQLLPLTRSSSTSAPTLLVREIEGRRVPRLGVGAAGNMWILPSVFHTIVHVLDGASAQQAVEAPRFLVGRDPSDRSGRTARVQIEDRYPAAILEELARRGHRFHKIGRKGELRYGYASAVAFDPDRGRVEAGADPRRSHRAVAVH